MPDQERTFTCDIDDRTSREHFGAVVKVIKKAPIMPSAIDVKRIELAHIYITPVADQWKGARASFTQDSRGEVQKSTQNDPYALRDGRPKDHSHFVLFDAAGNGKYIRRNRYGTDVDTRMCSVWDLGPAFGTKVADALRDLM